jgi:hypothetical protein
MEEANKVLAFRIASENMLRILEMPKQDSRALDMFKDLKSIFDMLKFDMMNLEDDDEETEDAIQECHGNCDVCDDETCEFFGVDDAEEDEIPEKVKKKLCRLA